MFSKKYLYILVVILCVLSLSSCYFSGTSKALENALAKEKQIIRQRQVTAYDLGSSIIDPSKRVVMLNTDIEVDEIFYTTNGSDPLNNGLNYYDNCKIYETSSGLHEGILLDPGTVVNAFSVTKNEASQTTKFTIVNPASITDFGLCIEDENSRIIYLFSQTQSSDIYYSTDGSSPNVSHSSYYSTFGKHTNQSGEEKSGILVPNNSLLKIMEKYPDGSFSAVQTFIAGSSFSSLEIKDHGLLANDEDYRLVQITSSNPNARIYYTTDGTQPDITSKLYVPTESDGNGNKCIKISSYSPLKAVVYDGIYSEAATLDPYYNRVKLIDEGRYNSDTFIISLMSEIEGAQIYYTLDGSIPTQSSTLYEPQYYRNDDGVFHGILVPHSTTIKYVAFYNDTQTEVGSYDTGLSSTKTILFNTNGNQWGSYSGSGINLDDYCSFYSISNYHVGGATATMYINISGFETFTIYIRSSAEKSFDYTIAYEADSTTNEKANTKDSPQEDDGSNLENNPNYVRVTYTDLQLEPHTIAISYKKDNIGDVSPDRGYLVVPKYQ